MKIRIDLDPAYRHGDEGVIYMEGPLIGDTTKEGELHVWAHDPEGNVLDSVVVAPGGWRLLRWIDPPTEQMRVQMRKLHHDRMRVAEGDGMGGFL